MEINVSGDGREHVCAATSAACDIQNKYAAEGTQNNQILTNYTIGIVVFLMTAFKRRGEVQRQQGLN